VVTAAAQGVVVVRVHSLAWEHVPAVRAAKKERKSKKKKNMQQNNDLILRMVALLSISKFPSKTRECNSEKELNIDRVTSFVKCEEG